MKCTESADRKVPEYIEQLERCSKGPVEDTYSSPQATLASETDRHVYAILRNLRVETRLPHNKGDVLAVG